MGDILSQSEIEELLKAMGDDKINIEEIEVKDEAENSDEKSISEYNFEKPPKFNKEQLRTLEIIYDNFSRVVSSYLTGYLRVSTQIEVNSAEQITFKEFYGSIQNPVIIAIVDFLPLKGSIILELSASVGYAMIDRILGGPGLAMEKIREFSDIEVLLLRRIITHIIGRLVEPWESILPLEPRLEKIETNAQFAQIISPNEMIALTSLKIMVGGVSGYMNFCLPHLVLEPIVKNLNNRIWYSSSSSDDEESYRYDLENKLEKTNLSVNAVLGKTFINVSDFVDLKVGDVIALDSTINSDIKIYISENLKYYGKPGKVKNRNSVQITEFAGKDEF
ncbi:MAG: flagellar motor switch protein FliM [Lachnospirales bacterium]